MFEGFAKPLLPPNLRKTSSDDSISSSYGFFLAPNFFKELADDVEAVHLDIL